MNCRTLQNDRQRGSMLVEAAIVLPLLLLLTLGAIEYGWLLLNMQQMSNAARNGARVASVLAGTGLEGETAIDNLLAGTAVSQAASFTRDVDDATDPNMVVATISVSSSEIAIVNAPAMFPIPATLRVNVRMKKEGG